MARFVSTITKTGPLFEHDPEKTFAENARQMLEAVAEQGEADVRGRARSHSRTGAFMEGIRGRVESVNGKDWYRNAVISQTTVYPWPKGGQREYRGGKLERRYRFFAGTARVLRNARAINTAELTKGLT